MAGKVTLVGAGPGDEGLITVKGMAALQAAEVVIYDRLVGEEILDMIPDTAERINAGKASADHRIPQEEINALLLKKAEEGKNVVRLKGGDCYLFGRGGEELELLYENGIEFEVIPGVTSALAVPAYAGIPVTHRDCASSVHILTAHARAGKKLDIDFKALVKAGGTLVFLMGAANMEYIVNGLKEGGMSAKVPCAVIERGTTWGQKKYIGTIENIEDIAKDAKSPAVIVAGDVCDMSEKYDRFSKRPLFGTSVIVTRPKDRAGTLVKRLRERGARVIECPSIETESLMDESLTRIAAEAVRTYNWTVFTSPTGVKYVMEAFFEAGYDARIFGGSRLAAVGKATAEELLKYGLRADIVPLRYDGETLGELLAKRADKNETLLLLRAEDSSARLNEILDDAGYTCCELAVYRTRSVCGRDLTDEINRGGIDCVTFTSASTVRGFAEGHKNIDKSKLAAVCIGSLTAAEAEKYGFRCVKADRAEINEMIKLIEERRWNI